MSNILDKREQVLRDIEISLLGKIPEEYIQSVSNSVTLVLDKYEIQDRCTDLVVVDEATNSYQLKMYLSTCIIEGKRERTVRRYNSEISRFLTTIDKDLKDITTFDVRKYFALMLNRGCTQRTVENTRSCLSPFFTWLYNENVIQQNPMAKVKPIKYHSEQEEAFSSTDVATMRDSIDNVRDRALFEFLLSTGVRVSELCSLELSDVDFQSATVYIRDGKGGKPRKTYISKVALQYLRKYLDTRTDKGTKLFIGKRGSLSTSGVRVLLKKISKDSGVTNVHPHRFRHTFATNLTEKGMPIQHVQVLLGHSSIETTRVYVSTTEEHIKNSYLHTS